MLTKKLPKNTSKTNMIACSNKKKNLDLSFFILTFNVVSGHTLCHYTINPSQNITKMLVFK